MQVIADLLDIHPVEVHSVVSFYSFLDERPQGQFVIRLCRTITCDMAGKEHVARQLVNDLGIDFGETTPDGKFSLGWANCLGMCDQGPGPAGERQHLHPGDARKRSTASWSSAGRRSAPTRLAAQGASPHDRQDPARIAHLSARSSRAAGLAAALRRPPADALAQIEPRACAAAAGPASPPA